jgi:hypothetical protein
MDYKEKIIKMLKEKHIPQDPVERQVQELKKQLESEDYKIIKCAEYQLIGKELPYNIEELNQKRDMIREQINELETD